MRLGWQDEEGCSRGNEGIALKRCRGCGETWTPDTPGFEEAESPANSIIYGQGVLEFLKCIACIEMATTR